MNSERKLVEIVEQVKKRQSSEFSGDLTIHFRRGVPTGMESRECWNFKGVEKSQEKAREP